jgi:hypothetical protein
MRKACTHCETPHELTAENSYRGQCKVHIQQMDAQRYRERYAEKIKIRRMIRNKIIADHYAATAAP